MYQKYISKISPDNLQKLLVELNKIAITEGIEDLEKIRQDIMGLYKRSIQVAGAPARGGKWVKLPGL